jgi:hypothetical protein
VRKPEYDELGLWKPRSAYFLRHYYRDARAKRMAELEATPEKPLLAFCPTCGAAFLQSVGRPWSPCHAADPEITYDLDALVELLNLVAEKVLSPSETPKALPAPLGPDAARDAAIAATPPPTRSPRRVRLRPSIGQTPKVLSPEPGSVREPPDPGLAISSDGLSPGDGERAALGATQEAIP